MQSTLRRKRENRAVQFTHLGDRYEVGQVIGRGGMAEVHEGADTRLNRRVAIKILRPDLARDPQFQDRFRREAQAAAGLNHPNVVAVFDTGEQQIGEHLVPYIVMEYVDGVTLQHMLTNGPRIMPERSLEITAGILAALDYAHRHGIVHRDIKPANIMINAHGDAKVMDFGIARAMSDAVTSVTASSAVMGTAQYLSPEQAKGETVDARSDIYAAGCVMYELLTGRPPFTGETAVSIAYQHVNELPKPPSQVDSAISATLDAVVLHALAKHPSQRYQTAAEMRSDVERVMAGMPVAVAVAAAEISTVPTVAIPLSDTTVMPRIQEQVAVPSVQNKPKRGRWIAFGLLATLAIAGMGLFAIKLFGGNTGIQAPTLVGLSVTDATQTLTDAKLKLGTQTPQNDPSAAPGTVLSQKPEAGTTINEGSAIDVVVSAGQAKATVPDLSSAKSQDDANKILGDAGLKLGTITQKDSPTNIDVPAAGTVLSQSPAAATSVEAGSAVNVTISSGKVTVPYVVGESKTQANNDLVNAGFNVQVIFEPHSDKPDGLVLAQTPTKGQGAAPGSKVTLTVAQLVSAPSSSPTSSKTPAPSISPSPSPSPSL
jgi:serine/threonine-protein kinase